MFRRKFFQTLTLAGASGLAVSSAADNGHEKTIEYAVQGFSCETCAVGLRVMLEQQKGIIQAKASYARARASVRFDPNLINEAAIKEFITNMGFTASEVNPLR